MHTTLHQDFRGEEAHEANMLIWSNSTDVCPDLRSSYIPEIVGLVFGVSQDCLFQKQRGKAHVALARQTLMYLLHVCGGLSYSAIGVFMGRDRTTVAYACRLIEDKREQQQIDWALEVIEGSLCRLVTFNQTREGAPHAQ